MNKNKNQNNLSKSDIWSLFDKFLLYTFGTIFFILFAIIVFGNINPYYGNQIATQNGIFYSIFDYVTDFGIALGLIAFLFLILKKH